MKTNAGSDLEESQLDLSADLQILTTGGRKIPAHSSVLALASPVLRSKLEQQMKKGKFKKIIRINGVPFDAVLLFVRSLYSRSVIEEEKIDSYAMHLLVLSHAYQIMWMKRACEMRLVSQLTAELVVDVLQLARHCDAQRLYLHCLRFIARNFATVQVAEAWRFLQEQDPWLELEILQFLQQTEQREKRRRRRKAEQAIYMELHEAMECVYHICNEGCTDVGPLNRAPAHGPCERFGTCHKIQLLIRHFASCHKKGCTRCHRTWQLLRLHSALCDQTDTCKVPLCMQFKIKTEQMGGKAEDDKWALLVKKMLVIKVMPSLINKNKAREQGLSAQISKLEI